ncbi:MAG: hypothetical protein AB7G20_11650 [Sulfurimonas sp.]
MVTIKEMSKILGHSKTKTAAQYANEEKLTKIQPTKKSGEKK